MTDTSEYWDDVHGTSLRPDKLKPGVCDCATPVRRLPNSNHCSTCNRIIDRYKGRKPGKPKRRTAQKKGT